MSRKVHLKIKLDRSKINGTISSCRKKAVWAALDYLASQSKDQVPLDTGVLKNSCSVDINADGSEGTVSYDTPYAVVQHEATHYNHQRGRKAKYLEDPVYDGNIRSAMVKLAGSAFSEKME